MRALITGAASGIGRATCLRLARDAQKAGRKAQIAAVDLGPSPGLDSLLAELKTLGAEGLPVHADMGSADAPARAVGEAVASFGGLDGLVSNAGINRPGALMDYALADWDAMFAVNTRATWLLAKAAYPALKASRGAIVAIASMSGSNAHANLGAYGPSKAAIIMLVKVLAQELARDGIRVNSVSPGWTWSKVMDELTGGDRAKTDRVAAPFHLLGRVGDPEEVARVVEGVHAKYLHMCKELSGTIVGMKDVTEQLMIGILCRGHCILQGMPDGVVGALLKSPPASAASWLNTIRGRSVAISRSSRRGAMTGCALRYCFSA